METISSLKLLTYSELLNNIDSSHFSLKLKNNN